MKQEIKNLIKKTLKKLNYSHSEEFSVDYPKVEGFGDYTTNIAMILAKGLKKNPIEVAESLKSGFNDLKKPDFEDIFEKIEVVKPGYINFYLSSGYLQKKVEEINKLGEKYGDSEINSGKKTQIEFISCNPTGPVHLGNGRGGPIGDILANILAKTGSEVTREFYVNDFGNQVEILGHSILKDGLAEYKGDYVDELAKKRDKKMTDPMEIGNWAAGEIMETFIKPTLEKANIHFDVWFSEKKLHEKNKIAEAIELLRKKGLTYEKDGALWYKSTEFGDDKDRVMEKSNGKNTYLATDFAYHQDKIGRGFDKIINIQGADHHKEAEVVKNFVERVLGAEGKIDYILSQIVRVIKDRKEVKMSKRRGVYFALDDLIDEVGIDAVRFIFASYAANSHINFDINVAREKSEKNPVYYVQYAHARIASILAKSKVHQVHQVSKAGGDLGLLTHEKELGLIRELDRFPELIEEISKSYEVHKLPYYAIKLADKFHSFYNDLTVLDEEKPELTAARLKLVNAVRIVLAETLRLIGVSAPSKM